MKHQDLGRKVMHNGMICRIIGVTYSHPEYRGSKPFYSYHLMPEGKHSLKDSIQYQTVDKLAFDPPKSYLSELETGRMGDASNRKTEAVADPALVDSPAISPQLSDKFITIDDAPYLELVKG